MDGAPSREQWVERYLTQLATQRQLSPLTVAAYRRDLGELIAATPGKRWEELAYADIRRVASSMHAQELAPRSIARKLSCWRVFFAWLARETPLAANPVEAVRAPKRPRSLPKALGIDQAVQLVSAPAHAHANPEPADLCNRAMFELLYSSGLRVSELAGLDVEPAKESLGWVDLEGAEVLVTGKGNKMRKVPVGSHALAALRDWLAVRSAPSDGSAALFVSSRGARITPRAIQQRLKTHAIRSGTPVHVHPHMLRHSFASHVLQSSGDLRAVQEMLGHASIASTQVYTELDFQHLAKVYDQAHPRAKSK